MTKEQYEEYEILNNKLKGVRSFCEWCGNRYKDVYCSKFRFNILTKGKQLFLNRKWNTFQPQENIYEIPIELQERIIEVVENYLDEKEKELLNI